MRPVVENTALTGTVYVLLHIHMFVRSLAVFFVLFLAIFVYRHFVILYIVLI